MHLGSVLGPFPFLLLFFGSLLLLRTPAAHSARFHLSAQQRRRRPALSPTAMWGPLVGASSFLQPPLRSARAVRLVRAELKLELPRAASAPTRPSRAQLPPRSPGPPVGGVSLFPFLQPPPRIARDELEPSAPATWVHAPRPRSPPGLQGSRTRTRSRFRVLSTRSHLALCPLQSCTHADAVRPVCHRTPAPLPAPRRPSHHGENRRALAHPAHSSVPSLPAWNASNPSRRRPCRARNAAASPSRPVVSVRPPPSRSPW